MSMIVTDEEVAGLETSASLQIQGIDYIEFYVGNAIQTTHFFRNTFGLTPTAYHGLETGAHDHVSYVVEHRKVRLSRVLRRRFRMRL